MRPNKRLTGDCSVFCFSISCAPGGYIGDFDILRSQCLIRIGIFTSSHRRRPFLKSRWSFNMPWAQSAEAVIVCIMYVCVRPIGSVSTSTMYADRARVHVSFQNEDFLYLHDNGIVKASLAFFGCSCTRSDCVLFP